MKLERIITIGLITLSNIVVAQTKPDASEWWGLINNGLTPDNVAVQAWIDVNKNGSLDLSGQNTPDGSEVFDRYLTIGGYYSITVPADDTLTGVKEGGVEGDSIVVRVDGYDANPKLPFIKLSNARQDIQYSTVSIYSDSNVPNDFAVRNYPNPFNSNTNIEFLLPRNSRVNISVFDVKGNHVESMVNQYMQKGKYSLKWAPNNLPSGNYIYRLEFEDQTIVNRMTYLK